MCDSGLYLLWGALTEGTPAPRQLAHLFQNLGAECPGLSDLWQNCPLRRGLEQLRRPQDPGGEQPASLASSVQEGNPSLAEAAAGPGLSQVTRPESSQAGGIPHLTSSQRVPFRGDISPIPMSWALWS